MSVDVAALREAMDEGSVNFRSLAYRLLDEVERLMIELSEAETEAGLLSDELQYGERS